jgi:toxin FitB
MLLDSNIIIYAAKPEYGDLRTFIAEQSPAVSWVSYIEVLGYHRLTVEGRRYFEEFFATARLLAISEEVMRQAVMLRQQKKMMLGDALIASTAMVHDLTLVTRNEKDFGWVERLRVFNPFSSESEAT